MKSFYKGGIYISMFYCFIFLSCQNNSVSPSISLDDYSIQDNFNLSLTASEPFIQAPIALDFDNQGRIWVLEMPGYMANIDGTGEEDPVGRVVILEDEDQDGYFEKSKIFLDSLIAARAICLVYGGLLYAEPPNLWFVDINNNQAGKKTLVDPEYAVGGNIEHQPNGLDLNIDNWIYSAKAAFRYRMKEGKWLKERTTFRGQWGLTHDNEGRLFYNDNSNPLYGDLVRPNQFNQHPYFKNKRGENEVIVKDRRVYPIQATAVNRGYIAGTLDERDYLINFTSACGPMIYRGDHFPESYNNNPFVCGPEANLVKRLQLTYDSTSIIGTQVYSDKEFLISKDEAFRPVNLHTGPDGAMYIVDFHNGIIQHKVYLTAYLREQYKARGLDTIQGYGRILKVSQGDPKFVLLGSKTNTELVAYLDHKNGWVRDRAQQLLIERDAQDVVPLIKEMAAASEKVYGPVHALWTLEGLNALDIFLMIQIAQQGQPAHVNTAVQLTEHFPDRLRAKPVLQIALDQKDPTIDLQIALSAGKVSEEVFPILKKVLDRHLTDTIYIEATLANLAGKEKQFHYFLTIKESVEASYPILSYLEKLIKDSSKPKPQAKFTLGKDSKTEGLRLYRTHCSSCHGEDGIGNKNLAPPLQNSEYVSGDPQRLIKLTLHGLQGPVTVNGQRYEFSAVMPGLKDNPELNDQDIANILTFIRNSFSNIWEDIKVEDVKAGRSLLPNDGMYTEKELLNIE